MTPADFTRLALTLPGAEQGSHMGAVDFRVGGRIFATLAAVSKGYGNVMLSPEQQREFIAELPGVFLPVAGGWGEGGATHIRLSAASEDVVRGALQAAWKRRTEANEKTRRKPTAGVRTAPPSRTRTPSSRDNARMSKPPSMPVANAATMRRFERLVPKNPAVVLRPMFGHRAAFVNGRMFAGTFGSDLVVRLDEPARAALLAVAGTKPFEPMKGRPMKEYVVLPRAWAEGGPHAATWIARAFEWTSSMPPKDAKGAEIAAQKKTKSATKERKTAARRGRQ